MNIVKIKWCRTRFVPGEAPIEECKEENYDEFESVGFLINKALGGRVIATRAGDGISPRPIL